MVYAVLHTAYTKNKKNRKSPIINYLRFYSVIQVTFFNRLIINYLHDCIAYNMPTFLIYYRLFLT